jgi:hypothetical protein
MAATLLGYVESYFVAAGAVMWPPDRLAFAAARAAVQSRFPADWFAAHWARGSELTLDLAIAIAVPSVHRTTPDI